MTNLADAEIFTELDDLAYDREEILPELILLTSLILRDHALFVAPLDASPEYKQSVRQERNTWLEPLIPNLLNGKRELFYTDFIPFPLLLPDVCLQCKRSFGLTVAGRLRNVCPLCYEDQRTEAVRGYIALQQEMGVFWVPYILFETLIAQLIYKYYSPNGDPKWTLSLPQLAGL